MPIHGGGAAAAASVVGPSNVLYVDIAGVDATGTRGNAAKPFLTVQAALNAAQSGDQIRIGPSTFAPAATLVIPATITNLSFIGSGAGPLALTASTVTRVIGPAALPLFDLGVNLGLVSLNFQDLLLGTGANGTVIRANGSLYAANSFISNGIGFTNVNIVGTTALDLRYTRNWRFVNCVVNGAVTIVSGGSHVFDQCQIGANHVYDYDGTDPLRTTGQLSVIIRGPGSATSTGVFNVTLSGQARFFGDPSCNVTAMTGLNLSVSGALRPLIQYFGSVGTIDFQSTAAKMLPDTVAGSISFDFSGCILTGASALFEVTAPSTAQNVLLTGAVGSASAQTIRANAGIALTARGNAFRAPTYATAGTGTINPGQINLSVALAGANQAVSLGFTSPVTTYVPSVSTDTLATGAHAENTFTTAGFNIQTAAGGGNARVSVTWP